MTTREFSIFIRFPDTYTCTYTHTLVPASKCLSPGTIPSDTTYSQSVSVCKQVESSLSLHILIISLDPLHSNEPSVLRDRDLQEVGVVNDIILHHWAKPFHVK